MWLVNHSQDLEPNLCPLLTTVKCLNLVAYRWLWWVPNNNGYKTQSSFQAATTTCYLGSVPGVSCVDESSPVKWVNPKVHRCFSFLLTSLKELNEGAVLQEKQSILCKVWILNNSELTLTNVDGVERKFWKHWRVCWSIRPSNDFTNCQGVWLSMPAGER